MDGHATCPLLEYRRKIQQEPEDYCVTDQDQLLIYELHLACWLQ